MVTDVLPTVIFVMIGVKAWATTMDVVENAVSFVHVENVNAPIVTLVLVLVLVVVKLQLFKKITIDIFPL